MAASIQSLRLLVRLKKRRLEALDAALADARNRVREAEAAEEQTRQAEEKARGEEYQHAQKLADACSGARPVLGSDVTTLMMIGEALAAQTAQAAKAVQAAAARVAQERQSEQQALRERRRGEQQLKLCEERLQKLLDEAEAARDDLQDEESEEASVARMLASARERADSRQSTPFTKEASG